MRGQYLSDVLRHDVRSYVGGTVPLRNIAVRETCPGKNQTLIQQSITAGREITMSSLQRHLDGYPLPGKRIYANR